MSGGLGPGPFTERAGSWGPVQKGRPGLGLALPLSSGQTDTIKNITFVTWLAGVNNVVVLDDNI